MRKSPLNYFYALLAFVILWLILGLGGGVYFSDSITLSNNNMTNDDWMNYYWIITGIISLLGYVLVVYWFMESSHEEVSLTNELEKMNGRYKLLLIISIVFAVLGLMGMLYFFWEQGIDTTFYLLFIIINLALCSIGFWISTYLFTPKATKYCVLGR